MLEKSRTFHAVLEKSRSFGKFLETFLGLMEQLRMYEINLESSRNFPYLGSEHGSRMFRTRSYVLVVPRDSRGMFDGMFDRL